VGGVNAKQIILLSKLCGWPGHARPKERDEEKTDRIGDVKRLSEEKSRPRQNRLRGGIKRLRKGMKKTEIAGKNHANGRTGDGRIWAERWKLGIGKSHIC